MGRALIGIDASLRATGVFLVTSDGTQHSYLFGGQVEVLDEPLRILHLGVTSISVTSNTLSGPLTLLAEGSIGITKKNATTYAINAVAGSGRRRYIGLYDFAAGTALTPSGAWRRCRCELRGAPAEKGPRRFPEKDRRGGAGGHENKN